MTGSTFEQFRDKAFRLCDERNLLKERIIIRARALNAEEALGNPEGEDFPLQKGKERLMQAEFRSSRGQAFTDQFGDFEGSVHELFSMSIANNYRRSVFIAAINAIMRDLGLIVGTVHCRDSGPSECASLLKRHIREHFGDPKVLQVGFQPKFLQCLADEFSVRALDLDPDNIGSLRYGVRIEGHQSTEDAIAWADLLLVTGTTLANDTVAYFLVGKPIIFYGTTIAGAAALMGWPRFCARSF